MWGALPALEQGGKTPGAGARLAGLRVSLPATIYPSIQDPKTPLGL